MRPLVFLLSFLVLAATARPAGDLLAHARQARTMLGPAVWSRIVQIENANRGGDYPRVVHALVFELAGRLWFYCAVNGTQSFSLHAGRLEEEKADFGPLLRDIEPGFGYWRIVGTGPEPGDAPGREPLPNGCFIESVMALQERVARGQAVGRPRLLSYYVDFASGLQGHTVLVYEAGPDVVVFDPVRVDRDATYSGQVGRDPLLLARRHEGPDVARARFLPLGMLGDASANTSPAQS
jgi:hypothetical protein